MRYPLQPLAQMAGMTDRQTLLALKVSGTTYQKYRDEGLPREPADRCAVKLGLHPYEVWPEMAEHDLAGGRARRARYQRAWYRNASPEVKARVLESARRYKRSTARAQALYLRRYRQANAERIAARKSAWYQDNRERILARQREYDRLHGEEIAAKKRAKRVEARRQEVQEEVRPQGLQGHGESRPAAPAGEAKAA